VGKKGLTRWVFASDLHGDHGHPPTLSALRQFMSAFQPDVRIFGGDLWDLRWLRKSASNAEKATAIDQDLECGFQFLDWFKPTVFLEGNHDVRLRDADENESDGPLRHLAEHVLGRIDGVLQGVHRRPYCKRDGVYRLGDCAFVHGYSHGQSAVRDAAASYGHVVMGHIHAVEHAVFRGLEPRRGYSVGCMCELDLGYNRAALNTLRQSHGFAYGVVIEGRTVVWQAEEVGGTWLFPSEIREVRTIDSGGRLLQPLKEVSYSSPTPAPPQSSNISRTTTGKRAVKSARRQGTRPARSSGRSATS
jgi:hypothetical protein